MTPTEILSLLSPLLVIITACVGYISLRSGVAKSEREISGRIRDALSEENNLLQSRIQRVELENKHLNRVMQLIIETLKKTNDIELEINGDIVTLRKSGNIQVNRLSD